MDNKAIINNLINESIMTNDMEKYIMYNMTKRIIDIICSLCGIILLCPILILTAFFIKIESNGPVIFKQTRIGRDGKPFLIYKFRSMRIDTPNVATNDLCNSDMFITKTGKIIRKTSIDELPQLFNIIKGDMSIVGPRPVIEKERELLYLREVNGVDKVLPGITGWAQINGRDNIDIKTKVRYDREYIVKRSLKLDIYIMTMTLLKVIKASDIKE